MLALPVADALREIAGWVDLLPGGTYPIGTTAIDRIDRNTTPLAFDDAKDLVACALVIDGPTLPFGPRALRDAAQGTAEIVVWQREGRDIIDAALALARRELEGVRVALAEGQGTLRELRFGGYLGPWRDEPLRANQGRLRLVAVRRLGA